MQVQPYLFFEGRCEEALEFYRQTLGAEIEMMMRYKESPEPAKPGKPAFQGFSLSVYARDDAHAKKMFGALAEGGEVRQPLTHTFFASSFGMLTDRFGVGWMVIAEKERVHG